MAFLVVQLQAHGQIYCCICKYSRCMDLLCLQQSFWYLGLLVLHPSPYISIEHCLGDFHEGQSPRSQNLAPFESLYGTCCMQAFAAPRKDFTACLLVQGVGLGTSAFNEFASSPPPRNGFEQYHGVPAQSHADTARLPTNGYSIPAASSSWSAMLLLNRTATMICMYHLAPWGCLPWQMFAHQMFARLERCGQQG